MRRTILVCGGRDYDDARRVEEVLREYGEDVAFVQGGAPGADKLCREYASDHGLPCSTVNADWATHGRAAGPIRNQKMLDEFLPSLVVAFPGGRGTADMVRRAQIAGVEVREVR